jgi:hypothetical protein
MWDRTAGISEVIWGAREGKSFCKQDWTGQISLIAKKNFLSARNGKTAFDPPG